jgi:ribonucleotide monophosphatase NagD (HAD superfamily)
MACSVYLILDDHGEQAVAIVGDSPDSDGTLADSLGVRFVHVVAGQRPDWEPRAPL